MRDFYDIYLIHTKEWDNINIDNFRKAIDKTFSKREYKGDLLKAINTIKNSDVLKLRWKNYQRKYKYAEDITFEDIINTLEEVVRVLEIVII